MMGWIRASRIVATFLLVILIASDLGANFGDNSQEVEAAGETVHQSGITSRGGPRPTPAGTPGLDALVAQPRLQPSPTPTPLPSPSPTPEPKPQSRDLGVFKVTGYSDSPYLNGTDGRGITRSGELTHWGVVAVDPDVIPLGTRLQIEGFGDTVFTALDTGGGIIGRWVDVWYGTDWDALQHGVKHGNVRVLLE